MPSHAVPAESVPSKSEATVSALLSAAERSKLLLLFITTFAAICQEFENSWPTNSQAKMPGLWDPRRPRIRPFVGAGKRIFGAARSDPTPSSGQPDRIQAIPHRHLVLALLGYEPLVVQP